MDNRNEEFLNVANILNSLQEVENYIISDMEGKVYISSSPDFDENLINVCIYLWIIGTQVGTEFKTGEPVNVIHYQKSKKILIVKYKNHILILQLTESTKFAVFKKRLSQLL